MRTINDKNKFAIIKREGNGTFIENDMNEDTEVFASSENTITVSREYIPLFYCGILLMLIPAMW